MSRFIIPTARRSLIARTSFVSAIRPAARYFTTTTNQSTNQSVDSRLSSEGSHSDFAPQSKQPITQSDNQVDDAKAIIQNDVNSHPVFLYMKGNPSSPRCGFSANVVRILQHLQAEFSSRDVLEDPVIRDAVKAFSDWPTLPQLYVKGEFVGGSDIVSQMFKSGELEKLLIEAGASKPAAATASA